MGNVSKAIGWGGNYQFYIFIGYQFFYLSIINLFVYQFINLSIINLFIYQSSILNLKYCPSVYLDPRL